ncbi:hypothetical protein EIP86_000543 [Pleurotus ostreatoroseus]|nr:hypothetical protein EIP86_000543 [Pleurotus ostreatoroseus]
MWNMCLPGAPMVDFHKFFDGGNITQEDLVTWVTILMYHPVRPKSSCPLCASQANSSPPRTFAVFSQPQVEGSPSTRTNLATSLNANLPSSHEKSGDPFTWNDYSVKPAVLDDGALLSCTITTTLLHHRDRDREPVRRQRVVDAWDHSGDGAQPNDMRTRASDGSSLTLFMHKRTR